MKFYMYHLQNSGIQEWPYPWNWESVVASMRWISIFFICKFSVYMNDLGPEFRKVWLPLWDEILYSLFAKFWYTRMALSLKSEKCGCLYEMKFYMYHLQNFGIQEWPWTWSRKNVVVSEYFFIHHLQNWGIRTLYKSYPGPVMEKVCLPLWDEFFIHHPQIFGT